jgi:uncharacterized DUF497 family protein
MLRLSFRGRRLRTKTIRVDYGEQRFVTLGFLAGIAVSLVHTETQHEIHIISFRKATTREEEILFRSIQD